MTIATAAKIRNTLRAAGARQSLEGTNRNGIARSSGGFLVTPNGETKYWKSGKAWRQRTVKDGTFTITYERPTFGKADNNRDDAERATIHAAISASGWSVTRTGVDTWIVSN